jgi:hypothetical protein
MSFSLLFSLLLFVFCTDNSLGQDAFTPRSDLTDLIESSPAFGNISVIVPIIPDDTTVFQLPNDYPCSYCDIYTNNLNESRIRLKESKTAGSFPRRKTLAHVLSTSGFVCDLPTYVIPRPLKQRTVQHGVELIIDCCKGIVDQELGRGSNGIVVVLEEEGQSDIGPIAIKSQSPTGCLAWEYEILKTIENRVRDGNSKQIGSLPFPTALSFVSLADGALLTTTAASRSGLNLIDLKNIYADNGEDIPEVLVLYYTTRMLHHIELLHWHAKVLVSIFHFP